MRTISCLGAATSFLLASIAFAPVYAQDNNQDNNPEAAPTCRAALEGHSFRLSEPPKDLDCCYVEPEVPWYLDQDPIIELDRHYLRDDDQNVYTILCNVDLEPTGSIGDDGDNGGGGPEEEPPEEPPPVVEDGKGNEGVGNGEDPPPPGHETNQNDCAGTSPGSPGSSPGSPDC